VDEGLGACFFGIPPERITTVKDVFGIPERFDPIGAITLGHPVGGGAKGSPSTRRRKPVEDVVHRSRWRE